MHLTPLELAVGIPIEAVGTLATARWAYHHPEPEATGEVFGWNWLDIALCLIGGLFWLPIGIILLIGAVVAWSPRKKAN